MAGSPCLGSMPRLRGSARVPGRSRALARFAAAAVACVSLRSLCFAPSASRPALRPRPTGRGGPLRLAAAGSGGPLKTFDELEVGEALDGSIVRRLRPLGYLVDIGADGDALLRAGEIGDGLPRRDFVRGDQLTFRVLSKVDGKIDLTLRAGDLARPVVEKVSNEDVSHFAALEPSVWLEGEVQEVLLNGVFVKVSPPDGGAPARGLLHESKFQGDLEETVALGTKVRVRVCSVKGAKIELSMLDEGAEPSAEDSREAEAKAPRAPVPEAQPSPPSREVRRIPTSDLSVGLELDGRVVRRYDPSGYFIDIGAGRNAFLPAGEIRVGLPGRYFKSGDLLTVRVLKILEDGKVDVTLLEGDLERPHVERSRNKDVSQFADVDKSAWLEGKVQEVLLYGAFVEVTKPGGSAPAKGMLHKSKISGSIAKEIVAGAEVRVRILDVDEKRKTMDLTMFEP